ncbi:RNA-binding protein 1 [Glycine max]|nr:RNA-binding protein 1 [Glycine max]
MSDAYWRYAAESRQAPSSIAGKRSRSDYDVSGVHDLPSYFPHDDDRGGLRVIRDTESLDASYERYLRSAQVSSYGSGQSTRTIGGRIPNRAIDDSHVANIGGVDRGTNAKDKMPGLSSGRADHSLPPDATSTLFVEGLPSNCTRREVAHIFRPFVGYKEVRLVSKESRQPGGDPLVLCFVDFMSPAHAATAMEALQGYKFDELDRNSVNLRFQFARYPGARIHSRWGGYDFERQVTSVAVIRTKSNIVVFVWGVLARDSDSACLRKLKLAFGSKLQVIHVEPSLWSIVSNKLQCRSLHEKTMHLVGWLWVMHSKNRQDIC